MGIRSTWKLIRRVYLMLAAVGPAALHADPAEDLAENDRFYSNYAEGLYSRLAIQRNVVGLYDGFGSHITDGVNLYNLTNTHTEVGPAGGSAPPDSTTYSATREKQRRDFYEKFSNLIVLQDGIGAARTSFLVGDRISTRFTPLTFNKYNFRGIRWDLAAPRLQLSWLLSRTRPGSISMKERDGESLVEYPLSRESFGGNYYWRGIRGDRDFSTKSPYGDYEWLWAAHAQQEFADKFRVGLTYINHHVSDIKKGEHWIRGNIPAGWVPGEIHFELYDLTPQDTTDAGVYVHDITMRVNGRKARQRSDAEAAWRLVRVGQPDGTINPARLPLDRPQSGMGPVIVAFAIDPAYWEFADGSTLGSTREIRRITFEYTVAGNYLVFVSTDRQIPLAIAGRPNDQTHQIDYRHPDKSIRNIYNNQLAAEQSGDRDFPNREQDYATTFFGDYIAKSPHTLSLPAASFASACRTGAVLAHPDRYNYVTRTYRYEINVASETYGVNFEGELAGVELSGEAAVNRRQNMFPGRNESRANHLRFGGSLKARRRVGGRAEIESDLYHIAPQWRTSLDNMQSSRFYSRTAYSTTESRSDRGYSDYLKHPTPFDNGWSNIDDNDDNDPFVENSRRRYPSDLHAKDDRHRFYDDGTLRWDSNELEPLLLPNGFLLPYDDPDGVAADKLDRNRNGTSDYLEDFLLFTSDPPVFELANDLNYNGVYDWEDDDIIPDFGHSVGYVLTSNGIKTLGVRGLHLKYKVRLDRRNTVEVGARVESVADRDLVPATTGSEESELDASEGRAQSAYLVTRHETLSRRRGIHFELGNEVRVVRDGIRNDAVGYWGENREGDFVVEYTYITDPLNYRQAVLDNLVAGVTYQGIPEFTCGLRAKAGLRRHFSLRNETTADGRFHTVRTLRNPVTGAVSYQSAWEEYQDRLVADAYAVARASRRLRFTQLDQSPLLGLDLLERLEIVPQYKFAVSYSKELYGPDAADPRDLARNLRWYHGLDSHAADSLLEPGELEAIDTARISWSKYTTNNLFYAINVPILKAAYRLGQSTNLEMGVQWKRLRDMISPERNHLAVTWLAQLTSRAHYKGYSVTFLVGARLRNQTYDVNVYDRTLGLGGPLNHRESTFFAKLYSGI